MATKLQRLMTQQTDVKRYRFNTSEEFFLALNLGIGSQEKRTIAIQNFYDLQKTWNDKIAAEMVAKKWSF